MASDLTVAVAPGPSATPSIDIVEVTMRHVLDLAHAAEAGPDDAATARYHAAAACLAPDLVQELRRAWLLILRMERVLNADPEDGGLDPEEADDAQRAMTRAARHIRRKLRAMPR